MHNVSVQRPAQTLSVIGIERIHTHYDTLHRNSLNTIYIVGCVNPCLEFEIWGNRRFKEIIHIIFTISTSYIYVFARFTVDKDDGADAGGGV